jgi:hypothetical protein
MARNKTVDEGTTGSFAVNKHVNEDEYPTWDPSNKPVLETGTSLLRVQNDPRL